MFYFLLMPASKLKLHCSPSDARGIFFVLISSMLLPTSSKNARSCSLHVSWRRLIALHRLMASMQVGDSGPSLGTTVDGICVVDAGMIAACPTYSILFDTPVNTLAMPDSIFCGMCERSRSNSIERILCRWYYGKIIWNHSTKTMNPNPATIIPSREVIIENSYIDTQKVATRLYCSNMNIITALA
jgi:hypothetical protein